MSSLVPFTFTEDDRDTVDVNDDFIGQQLKNNLKNNGDKDDEESENLKDRLFIETLNGNKEKWMLDHKSLKKIVTINDLLGKLDKQHYQVILNGYRVIDTDAAVKDVSVIKTTTGFKEYYLTLIDTTYTVDPPPPNTNSGNKTGTTGNGDKDPKPKTSTSDDDDDDEDDAKFSHTHGTNLLPGTQTPTTDMKWGDDMQPSPTGGKMPDPFAAVEGNEIVEPAKTEGPYDLNGTHKLQVIHNCGLLFGMYT